jgi:hypothetical protein
MATTEERQKALRDRLPTLLALDPKVPITLGGSEYTIEVTNRTAIDVLKILGVNLLTEGIKEEKWDDPEFVGTLLYLGLQKNHPDLTLDQVNNLISHRHHLYMRNRLAQSFSLFYPDLSDLPRDDSGSARGNGVDPT